MSENSRPFHSAGDLVAVARDARRSCTTASRAAAQAVDEARLAHVRIADDGDLPHRARQRADDPRRRPRRSSGRSCRPRPRRRPRPSGESVARACRAGRGSSAPAAPAATSAPSSLGAAARALARVGGEEDLHLGVGRDDRADVAALGDPVALRRSAGAAARPSRCADLRVGGDLDGLLGDLGRADRGSVTSSPSSSDAAVASKPISVGCARRGRAARGPPRGTSRPCRGR